MVFHCRRVDAETGDISRQVPALTLVQLIGERRHVGAFDALPKGAVDRVETQAVLARDITQVRRRRLQADPCRAIASTTGAVAHRAMLGIQRCTAHGVRRNDRRLADLVGHRQLRTQLPRLAGNTCTVLALGDRRAQCQHALLQLRLLRLGRQRCDKSLQRSQKLKLLLILGAINHLACLDRRRVVGANVVEYMQGLGSTFDGVSQQIEAAQR